MRKVGCGQGRDLASTCQGRCLAVEGNVGAVMSAFDPEASGPEVWTNSLLTLEGRAV